MKLQESFELWYCCHYWDFKYVDNGKRISNVKYDTEKDCYNHFDVDLAWKAYRAGFLVTVSS